LLGEGAGDHRGNGQHRGNDAEAQLTRETLPGEAQLLMESLVIGDHPLGPVEYLLPLGGEALEALGPLDDRHPHLVLEMTDSGRKCGLGDVAGRCSTPEMALASECG